MRAVVVSRRGPAETVDGLVCGDRCEDEEEHETIAELEDVAVAPAGDQGTRFHRPRFYTTMITTRTKCPHCGPSASAQRAQIADRLVTRSRAHRRAVLRSLNSRFGERPVRAFGARVGARDRQCCVTAEPAGSFTDWVGSTIV